MQKSSQKRSEQNSLADSDRKYSYYNQLAKAPKLKYNEQQKVRMYLKSGGSTMLICKGLTCLAADTLGWHIKKFIKEHGSELEGRFIFTRA